MVSVVISPINPGVPSTTALAILIVVSILLSLSVKKLFNYNYFVVNYTDKRVNIMKEIILQLEDY